MEYGSVDDVELIAAVEVGFGEVGLVKMIVWLGLWPVGLGTRLVGV